MKASKLLATYAEEVGLESERFQEYRLVAGAWPKTECSKNVCWTVHSILAHRHDRLEMIKEHGPARLRTTRSHHAEANAETAAQKAETELPSAGMTVAVAGTMTGSLADRFRTETTELITRAGAVRPRASPPVPTSSLPERTQAASSTRPRPWASKPLRPRNSLSASLGI